MDCTGNVPGCDDGSDTRPPSGARRYSPNREAFWILVAAQVPALLLLQSRQAPGHVTGLDIAEQLLNRARKRSDDAGSGTRVLFWQTHRHTHLSLKASTQLFPVSGLCFLKIRRGLCQHGKGTEAERKAGLCRMGTRCWKSVVHYSSRRRNRPARQTSSWRPFRPRSACISGH